MYDNLKNHQHYTVILYTPDKDIDQHAIDVLSRHFDHILVTSDKQQLLTAVSQSPAVVVFMSFEHFADALQFYYTHLEPMQRTPPTFKVAYLIARKDEADAYHAFAIDAIDDYVVVRPLYEVHRPILVATTLMRQLGVMAASKQAKKAHFKQLHLNTKVEQQMLEGLRHKKALKEAFTHSINELQAHIADQSQHLGDDGEQVDVKEVKALLSQLCSNELRPTLLHLQQQALDLLEQCLHNSSQQSGGTVDTSKVTNESVQPCVKDAQVNNVLLVDHDEVSLQLSARCLAHYQCQVVEVLNGREALKLLQQHAFDLIVLDINLDDSDGINIAYQIQHNQGTNQQTPLILMVKQLCSVTKQRAKDAGFEVLLEKPLTMKSLDSALTQLQRRLALKE